MNRIRILGLAALATFALGAITATAAQAREGPFFNVCRPKKGGQYKDSACKKKVIEGGLFEPLRLEEAETEGLTAKAGKAFTLKAKELAVECGKLQLEPGATINGSTGANFSFSEQVILFEECTVAKNGTPCEPYSEKNAGVKQLGKIRTASGSKPQEPITITGKLAWPKKIGLNAGEKMLVLFEPSSKGEIFTFLKFTGAGCKVLTATVEGSVAAEAWQNGKAVGLEQGEYTVANQVNFPKEQITAAFVETNKVKSEVPVGLVVLAEKANLEGLAEMELKEKEAWGVFG